MIRSIKNGGVQVLEEALVRRGLRLTGPRRLLLQVIAAQGGLFTAEAVHRQAPQVGRATVFRTLKALVQAGVVCRVATEEGSPRYWLAPSLHHHHLICIACGAVRDFTHPDLETLVHRLAAAADLRVVGHRLEVYGLCARCQRKEEVCSA